MSLGQAWVHRPWRRVRNAWRRHGALGFVHLSAYNLMYFAKIWVLGRTATEDDDFDLIYGTETTGIHAIGSLDISSPNSRFARQYEPSRESVVRGLIDRLGVDISKFTFVDFGSGKGRVLLIAAAYPFVEVIGVEFASELQEVAVRNIARLPPEMVRENRVRSVCIDAVDFDLPASNLVCYFYDPFDEPIVSRIAERLIAHQKQRGYEVIVVYANPRHLNSFQRGGAFHVTAQTASEAVLTIDIDRGAAALEMRERMRIRDAQADHQPSNGPGAQLLVDEVTE